MNVSVIMSTYKESESFLRLSIESILDQSYRDFEFIIVLDNPENILHKKIISEYMKKDKRIRFYENKINIGLTKSLNKAISYAKGEYIARMDADDISLKKRLELQYRYLTQYNYDLIGGITQMIDEDGTTIYSIKKIPTDLKKIKKVLKYGQCIAHPTWFGKREIFNELNGYREIPLCEDYDFTLRAVMKNYKISNLNETVLKYRMTSNSISRSNLYTQFLYMKYITKNYSNGKSTLISDAHQYVKENTSDKKAKNYLKANVIFNRMLVKLEQKKLISFFKDGIQLLFTSKAYLNKVYRFIMLAIYS